MLAQIQWGLPNFLLFLHAAKHGASQQIRLCLLWVWGNFDSWKTRPCHCMSIGLLPSCSRLFLKSIIQSESYTLWYMGVAVVGCSDSFLLLLLLLPHAIVHWLSPCMLNRDYTGEESGSGATSRYRPPSTHGGFKLFLGCNQSYTSLHSGIFAPYSHLPI